MRFTKPKKVVGLDIGSHAVKAVQMSRAGNTLCIDDVGYALVDPNQINVDPITAQADALREALRNISVNQSMLVGALPGQTVVIRYPRLRDIAEDEIDQAIEAEASQSIPYDLSEVFLDWSLLDEEMDGEEKLLKVLLVAAKNEVIESRVQVADAAEVEFSALSVDSLALADAAEGCQMLGPDESVALINLGATSVSIHFTKDGVSNFIRDISWGAKEMIHAIAKARRIEFEDAEAILFNFEKELERSAEIVEATAVSDEEETSATPPPLDTSEGSSLLEPLAEELGELEEETSAPQDTQLDDLQTATPLDEILAMPIAKLVAEVRRSFDYYEHQLYERPVERIILSGGAAHITPIQDALRNDLGIEDVSAARPADGAIRIKNKSNTPEFENYPAQFMVAVGLAARGVAEL